MRIKEGHAIGRISKVVWKSIKEFLLVWAYTFVLYLVIGLGIYFVVLPFSTFVKFGVIEFFLPWKISLGLVGVTVVSSFLVSLVGYVWTVVELRKKSAAASEKRT